MTNPQVEQHIIHQTAERKEMLPVASYFEVICMAVQKFGVFW